MTVHAEDDASRLAARQFGCGRQDSVQHGREVAGMGGDQAQRLGGGGLQSKGCRQSCLDVIRHGGPSPSSLREL